MLVVFDLDQTLVDCFEVHDGAVARAFKEFFGADGVSLKQLDFAGRSLLESFTELARIHGVPDADFTPRRQDLLRRYGDNFVAGYPPDPTPYLLPGVVPLLQALHGEGDYLVLYTGDSRRVAEQMLTAANLEGYFRQSFFGTEYPSRAAMVRHLIRAASKDAGRDFSGSEVVIIGDSARDVACARECGTYCIAVATGLHTATQLEQAGPDHLLTDLSDTAHVLGLIRAMV